MSGVELWDRIKSIFINNDIMSRESFDEDYKDALKQFSSYNIHNAELYYLYNGLNVPEIKDYLRLHKETMVNYFFSDDPDDYVCVLGADSGTEKFILFKFYDVTFERHIGNFMRVNDWPYISRDVRRMEEVLDGLYQQYGSK